jgi:hypothetical protein
MLPRVALLAAAATGVVLLVAARGAAAQDTPPANPFDTVSGTVGSSLDLLPAIPAPAPALALPDTTGAPGAVGAPVPAVTDTARPSLDTAPAGLDTLLAAGPTATPGALPTTATPRLDLGTPPPTALAAPAPPGPAAAADLAPLTDALPTAVPIPATVRVPADDGAPPTVPGLGGVDIPAFVPAALAAPTGTLPAPLPLPEPLPAEPASALLRPATPPSGGATVPGPAHAAGPAGAVVDPPDNSLELVLVAIQHAFDDLRGGPNPARGPPDELPRDPSHRGSTDQTAQAVALPGTDRIGVTRAESWDPGTDVELTTTPPEPSFSPD